MRVIGPLLAVSASLGACSAAPAPKPLANAEGFAALAKAQPIANRVFRVDCSNSDQFRFLTRVDARDRVVAIIVRKADSFGVRVTFDRRTMTPVRSETISHI